MTLHSMMEGWAQVECDSCHARTMPLEPARAWTWEWTQELGWRSRRLARENELGHMAVVVADYCPTCVTSENQT